MSRSNSTLFRRRDWLRLAGGTAGLAALGGAGALLMPTTVQAGDYKALVCIFLFGGNDGFNMLVPTDTGRYNQYSTARGELALPKSSLVGLQGSEFGLHPAMAALRPVWSAGHLAPVVNVGPLNKLLTKNEYLALDEDSPSLPSSLFSHSDQQRCWESAFNDPMSRTGWGARTAEVLRTSYPVISLGGNSRFGTGSTEFSLCLPGPGGVFAANGLSDDELIFISDQKRKAALDALYAPGQSTELGEVYASMQRDAFEMSERLAALVVGEPGDPGVPTEIDRAFASLIQGKTLTTSLGGQLYQIAKLIAGREQVQGDRHVYFASLNGFDTHAHQVLATDRTQGTHATLLSEVADALAAFHNAMQNLGLGNQVTAFTQSDFGRTFLPNSSQGSDHAWGNVQLVSGGAVRGGYTYGNYPTPVLGGPDDVGVEDWEKQGRWIPTSSVDQYAATLLSWFGVTPSQMSTILPNLDAFQKRNLGFMGASAGLTALAG